MRTEREKQKKEERKNEYMTFLDAAFAHPRGLAGRVGAMIMGRATKQRNQWTISLLDLHPETHILEVGFGPGALIQEIATQVPDGSIAGIDASPLMVKQATRRNNVHIKRNHVALRAEKIAIFFTQWWFESTGG